MKLLIIGATGLAGTALNAAFSNDKKYTVIGTSFSQKNNNFIQLDLRNKKDIEAVVKQTSPDIIIHAAANSNVEYCEDHVDETRNVNIDGSMCLIESAKSIGAKFVYFSSDYVFDGTSGPYSEDDLPNPINEYGMQKANIEEKIEKYLSNYLIIRTTVLYGWEPRGKNFVVRLIENLKEKKHVKVPHDQVGSPTYIDNMAQAVKTLIEKNKTGIYNVCGSELIDRYSFAVKTAKVFGLEEKLLTPVVTKDLQQKAERPLNAGMKTTKIENELSLHLMNTSEGLKEMKKHQRN